MDTGTQRAWANVDLSAVAHNLDALWQGEGERAIIAVVKADAYGHGAIRVAECLVSKGASMLAVATVDEGEELRAAGVEVPIVLLGAFRGADCKRILDLGLWPSVSSVGFARELDEAARKRGMRAGIHVEIDTGMGRLGIPAARAVEAVEHVSVLGNLDMAGIYTHFAESEAEDKDFTIAQVDEFRRVVVTLESMGVVFKYRHTANSAACLEVPESFFNCLRPGLSLYGVHPGPECGRDVKLRPALELSARVVNVEKHPPGGTIGYGRTHRLERESRVAVISAGYADGVDRRLSNRGTVTIRGANCPILGRVSMDLTSVDATGVAGLEVGDTAVIYSGEADAVNCIDRISQQLDTIPHVLMCGISKRVPRIYKD